MFFAAKQGCHPENWVKRNLVYEAMERAFTTHFTTTRLSHLIKKEVAK